VFRPEPRSERMFPGWLLMGGTFDMAGRETSAAQYIPSGIGTVSLGEWSACTLLGPEGPDTG
jgi:hypothetical protein